MAIPGQGLELLRAIMGMGGGLPGALGQLMQPMNQSSSSVARDPGAGTAATAADLPAPSYGGGGGFSNPMAGIGGAIGNAAGMAGGPVGQAVGQAVGSTVGSRAMGGAPSVEGGNIAALNPVVSNPREGVLRALKARGRDPSIDFNPHTQAIFSRGADLVDTQFSRGGIGENLTDLATDPAKAQAFVQNLVDQALSGAKMFGGGSRANLEALLSRVTPDAIGGPNGTDEGNLMLAKLLSDPERGVNIMGSGLYGGMGSTMERLLLGRLASGASDYQQALEGGYGADMPGLNLLAYLLGQQGAHPRDYGDMLTRQVAGR
jgi:hypothetical protein